MDMYPKLFKRGKYWQIETARNKRKSLGVTDQKEAQKLLVRYKKAELEKKLAFLDAADRITLSEFVEKWTTNPDRKHLSPSTLRADRLAFKVLADALGDIPLKLVNKEAIWRFKDITAARVRPASLNTYLRHIKAGMNWAKQQDYIKRVPQIKPNKTGRALPRFLSKDDVKTLLAYTAKERPEMERVIRFALYTGARRQEIVAARYEHIIDGEIRIRGKGDKERMVPVTPEALRERQDIGKIFSYRHVSTVSNYFRELSRACGIKARFHDLRHTAGTYMLAAGIPIDVIRDILGHADIRTTEIYAQVLAETRSREIKKLSYE